MFQNNQKHLRPRLLLLFQMFLNNQKHHPDQKVPINLYVMLRAVEELQR